MRLVLVYDADCGLCTRFRGVVEFLDPRGRIAYTSIGEADASQLLGALGPSARHRSFHLVLPGSRVVSGASALPYLVAELPMGRYARPLFFGTRLEEVIAAAVYSVFTRIHASGACKRRERYLEAPPTTPN